MSIEVGTPTVHELDAAVAALREWQSDAAPFQLHPGDVGWFWRAGEDATAAALPTWTSDGRIVAVGLLDGVDLLRLTLAPDAYQDEKLATTLVADVGAPDRGVRAALQRAAFAKSTMTVENWLDLSREI
jgi:hypothetical protein